MCTCYQQFSSVGRPGVYIASFMTRGSKRSSYPIKLPAGFCSIHVFRYYFAMVSSSGCDRKFSGRISIVLYLAKSRDLERWK